MIWRCYPKKKEEDLFNVRNKLAHLCGFRDDKMDRKIDERKYCNQEIVEWMAEAHRVLTKLVLSFFEFQGVFCRYSSKDGYSEMTEITNNWDAQDIGDSWLDKFDKSRWMAIDHRENFYNWRRSGNEFVNQSTWLL